MNERKYVKSCQSSKDKIGQIELHIHVTWFKTTRLNIYITFALNFFIKMLNTPTISPKTFLALLTFYIYVSCRYFKSNFSSSVLITHICNASFGQIKFHIHMKWLKLRLHQKYVWHCLRFTYISGCYTLLSISVFININDQSQHDHHFCLFIVVLMFVGLFLALVLAKIVAK